MPIAASGGSELRHSQMACHAMLQRLPHGDARSGHRHWFAYAEGGQQVHPFQGHADHVLGDIEAAITQAKAEASFQCTPFPLLSAGHGQVDDLQGRGAFTTAPVGAALHGMHSELPYPHDEAYFVKHRPPSVGHGPSELALASGHRSTFERPITELDILRTAIENSQPGSGHIPRMITNSPLHLGLNGLTGIMGQLTRAGHWQHALDVYVSLFPLGLQVDTKIGNAALTASAHGQQWDTMLDILRTMLAAGCEFDSGTTRAVLHWARLEKAWHAVVQVVTVLLEFRVARRLYLSQLTICVHGMAVEGGWQICEALFLAVFSDVPVVHALAQLPRDVSGLPADRAKDLRYLERWLSRRPPPDGADAHYASGMYSSGHGGGWSAHSSMAPAWLHAMRGPADENKRLFMESLKRSTRSYTQSDSGSGMNDGDSGSDRTRADPPWPGVPLTKSALNAGAVDAAKASHTTLGAAVAQQQQQQHHHHSPPSNGGFAWSSTSSGLPLPSLLEGETSDGTDCSCKTSMMYFSDSAPSKSPTAAVADWGTTSFVPSQHRMGVAPPGDVDAHLFNKFVNRLTWAYKVAHQLHRASLLKRIAAQAM